MRIFPPVPTLTREAERDMELAGYKIPKGQMLGVAVFSMHNNPAYWKVWTPSIMHFTPVLVSSRSSKPGTFCETLKLAERLKRQLLVNRLCRCLSKK
jgi:hypothetical protein